MISRTFQTDYQKIKEITADALELEPPERAEFLRVACAGDENLRREVESLLAESEKSAVFLEEFSVARVVQNSLNSIQNKTGEQIGNYRIETEIGRGGMGIVYLAERTDFHRRVAIKLIKRGMDSEAIVSRFNREREILAVLEHPFIAHLLDGGTTENDLPFFVMEYVEGEPIDEFCKKNNLPEKEILDLFRKVCEAVAFAHQKLIVHRDLKPSNILITKDRMPKLLDFGIAKLLNSTAEETQTNMRVLTPAYASPEQMRGEIIDTRTDVYSLGLILSKILGVQNAEKTNKNLKTDFQKPISDYQPLNRDLQNIISMSLREDAARRYGSVEKFAEDVRRYQKGLPVSARPATFSYRAMRFFTPSFGRRRCRVFILDYTDWRNDGDALAVA